MDRKAIEKQAKEILNSFAKALSLVEKEKIEEDEFIEKESTRIETEGKKADPGFKELFLKNAPQKNNDGIIAEKGDWK